MDAVDLVKALADPRRLRVLAAVALGTSDLTEVARVAQLSPREAAEALHRLSDAGLISWEGGPHVDHDALRALAAQHSPDAGSGTLVPFVVGRRLHKLPSNPDRRWSVLAHVATHALEAGRDYPERELVEQLKPWCDGGTVDTSALRRYLVEEGLISRGGGIYRLGSDGPPLSEGERLVRGMGLE